MTKPITPHEVVDAKAKAMPDEVIEVFNELIAKNWNGHQAVIKKGEAVSAIIAALDLEGNREIYDNNWLDVEDIFRKAGWDVKYDKPGYNETYEGYYTFQKKGRKG
jgi:hypothetical protein